jgi:hypothetical protein
MLEFLKDDTEIETQLVDQCYLLPSGNPKLERMADEVHQVWCEWMQYMFSQDFYAYIRWIRQMKTPYAQLSESEKESDREIARRYLEIVLSEENNADVKVPAAEMKDVKGHDRYVLNPKPLKEELKEENNV